MFAIYNRSEMWEDVFETVEAARRFVEKYCAEWGPGDFDDFMIVEIVPRLVVDIPPNKITWKDAE